MKSRNDNLYLLLGLLLLGGGGAVIYTQTRGLRLNNPGNIRHGSPWVGLAPDQPDPEFCKFIDMPSGIRAMTILLRNYASRYGLNTIAGIVSRWAPPSENETAAYIRAVSNSTGFAPDEPLNLNDPDIIGALERAIVNQEQGPAGNLIADTAFYQGIALA